MSVKDLLQAHLPFNEKERQAITDTLALLETHDDCLWRTCKIGHITASTWVVSPDYSQVLLLHHKGLNRWLQPGGHCDGQEDILAVACRELEEETGLMLYDVPGTAIFDVDVHHIDDRNHPTHGFEPGHAHHDVRFLIIADPKTPLDANTTETNGLKWVSLDEVEPSDFGDLQRMVEKTRLLQMQACA